MLTTFSVPRGGISLAALDVVPIARAELEPMYATPGNKGRREPSALRHGSLCE